MNTPRFQLDINLDDENECRAFLASHGTGKGRRLANALGLTGHGAVKAANALSGYAWNKLVAMDQRKAGRIALALSYEAICDRIYRDDIQPAIECW